MAISVKLTGVVGLTGPEVGGGVEGGAETGGIVLELPPPPQPASINADDIKNQWRIPFPLSFAG